MLERAILFLVSLALAQAHWFWGPPPITQKGRQIFWTETFKAVPQVHGLCVLPHDGIEVTFRDGLTAEQREAARRAVFRLNAQYEGATYLRFVDSPQRAPKDGLQ